VKRRLLDVVREMPVTVVVDRLRRAKDLLGLGWKTSGSWADGGVHVRSADRLCCVLSLLGRQIDRSSLLLERRFLLLDVTLLVLLILIVLFNDPTNSRDCILAALRHEAKIFVSSGTRSHCYVVDILRDGSKNPRRYASEYTFPGRVAGLRCHQDDRFL
jgi:hypothetical protein